MPFTIATLFALDSSTMYVGDPERFELHRYDHDQPTFILRRAYAPRLVDDGQAEAYRRNQREFFQREMAAFPAAARRHIRDLLDQTPFPEHFPPYQRLMIDEGDNLWVQGFEAPGDAAVSWSVFDPTGVWLGVVRMPQAFRMLDVGKDYALGVYEDELNVEYVRLYPLIKP